MSKRQVGICRAQRGGRDVLEAVFNDDGRGGGGLYFGNILPVRDECQIAGLCFLDADDALNINVAIAPQVATQLLCDAS